MRVKSVLLRTNKQILIARASSLDALLIPHDLSGQYTDQARAPLKERIVNLVGRARRHRLLADLVTSSIKVYQVYEGERRGISQIAGCTEQVLGGFVVADRAVRVPVGHVLPVVHHGHVLQALPLDAGTGPVRGTSRYQRRCFTISRAAESHGIVQVAGHVEDDVASDECVAI